MRLSRKSGCLGQALCIHVLSIHGDRINLCVIIDLVTPDATVSSLYPSLAPSLQAPCFFRQLFCYQEGSGSRCEAFNLPVPHPPSRTNTGCATRLSHTPETRALAGNDSSHPPIANARLCPRASVRELLWSPTFPRERPSLPAIFSSDLPRH